MLVAPDSGTHLALPAAVARRSVRWKISAPGNGTYVVIASVSPGPVAVEVPR